MQKPSQNYPSGYFNAKCFRNNQKFMAKNGLEVENTIVIDDDLPVPQVWKESPQNAPTIQQISNQKQPKQKIRFTFQQKQPSNPIESPIVTQRVKKYVDQSTQTKSSKKIIQKYIMNEIKKQAIFADQRFYSLPLNVSNVKRAFEMIEVSIYVNKYFNSLKPDDDEEY